MYLELAYRCICKHIILSIKDQMKIVPMEDFCAADMHSKYFLLIGFYRAERNAKLG